MCVCVLVLPLPRESELGVLGVLAWVDVSACLNLPVDGVACPAGPLALCALSGFAAPGGRCCPAPGPVPWLWPRVCVLCVVLSSRSRCVGRLSPHHAAVTAGFIAMYLVRSSPGLRVRGCAEHVEAGRELGSWCPPARPWEPRLAPRLCPSGPRIGVAPRGSLWRRSSAACAAVVLHVWTRSTTRPVSRTVRLAARCSASALGMFRVDANTSRYGLEGATLGSRSHLRVRVCPGRVARAGFPGAFWCASTFLWPVSWLSFIAWPPLWKVCPASI